MQLETFEHPNARWAVRYRFHLMYQVSLNNKAERSKDLSFVYILTYMGKTAAFSSQRGFEDLQTEPRLSTVPGNTVQVTCYLTFVAGVYSKRFSFEWSFEPGRCITKFG